MDNTQLVQSPVQSSIPQASQNTTPTVCASRAVQNARAKTKIPRKSRKRKALFELQLNGHTRKRTRLTLADFFAATDVDGSNKAEVSRLFQHLIDFQCLTDDFLKEYDAHSEITPKDAMNIMYRVQLSYGSLETLLQSLRKTLPHLKKYALWKSSDIS